jgi:hypothetical protein
MELSNNLIPQGLFLLEPARASNMKNKAIIFQGKNGGIELKSDSNKETIWATQAQVAELFEIERSVVTKHIKNIFKDNELDQSSVCANFAHTASDGKTYNVQYYNLDIILSVGYRTNSQKAIQFRQWATKILKDHVTKGFTINKKVIQKNHKEFLEAIEIIKKTLPAGDLFSFKKSPYIQFNLN